MAAMSETPTSPLPTHVEAASGGDMFDRAAAWFRALQGEICSALEALDGGAKFIEDAWQRPGGGGGYSRILSGGAMFEKAGVGWSSVAGELPADYAAKLPGDGTSFRATGVSLVLHPHSPMVPTTHANFRLLQKGARMWFGGGADLTPSYLFDEDVRHFHQTLKDACDGHPGIGDYERFKTWCDEYFYIPHRGEMRGVGGIFFDYLEEPDLAQVFAFVQTAGRAFVPAYAPIALRRRDEPWGEPERHWQLLRRGRYAEFNLVYDRGTVFGLKTNGRTESILMSMPPLARWDYNAAPAPGSREAAMVAALQPGVGYCA
ncbi:MAG: oxygen-dependent coproporphyrinogen oxidase [Myxococcales bacterium]|nr:oxygen-dependent coproporphyrinogen oxidase [Myxococcales bacterium]